MAGETGTNATYSEDELREKLREVDEDLERLRESARELRERIGDRSDAPTDAVEMAALITMAEEQEGIVGTLEARRETLRERLEQV
ncbi:hypothetical protein GCM10009677_09060 [Sphaerisporangium rubeum]|uniref:Uncharacterized protein n=1 Tax=Sphaerisporangium rubeum TaxID=321317 RepID=A0A7X0M9E9_9ACTN|nr:hypothetical protein [Sphaerisporangium rubeum]MBB6476585.1 hypothetical protein [Sphaerisporangium rubeum]